MTFELRSYIGSLYGRELSMTTSASLDMQTRRLLLSIAAHDGCRRPVQFPMPPKRIDVCADTATEAADKAVKIHNIWTLVLSQQIRTSAWGA